MTLRPTIRPKRCKQCREQFMPAKSMQCVCSPLCAAKYGAVQASKVKHAAELADRRETRARKEKLKTRSDWLKEAQRAFNAFIRERDKAAGFPCVSSGRPLDWSGNQVDAGHYRSTGAAPHLRFNEDNCHAQSKHDNQYLAGNAVDYRINLVARIGLERVEALECDETPRHYTIDDLKRIKAEYTARARELRKQAA